MYLAPKAGSAAGAYRASRCVQVCAAGVFASLIALSTNLWAWSWQDSFFGPNESRQPDIPWSYQGKTGPDHWDTLAAEFADCKGEQQSPVDLRGGRQLSYSPLTFRYRSNPLSMVNDGRSVRIDYLPGSYLIAGGRQYELTGFHFHLPGEHRINGRAADMEIQLVHRDRRGRQAVVAVPIKAGRRMNSTLSRIWDKMPPIGGQSYYGRQVGINPMFLLPARHDYYTYVGSLTEPPCTEGVEWFVLTEPLEVDYSYIHRLAQVVGSNARPVQPLNGRPVLKVSRR